MNRSSRTALAVALLAGLLVPMSASAFAPAVSEDAACTVVGTKGADRLFGTPGPDVICGRGGEDVLIGAGGDDVLRGGGGPDRLAGGLGDDELDGGPAADTLDGGPGNNSCTVGAADTAERCVYDLYPPAADELTVSADTVDVTEQEASVVVQVHVTDDTGARAVTVRPGDDAPWLPSANAVLTSGTARDGWWTATVAFHRGLKPGTFKPLVVLEDRLDRLRIVRFDTPSIQVLDASPDLDSPVITLISPVLDNTFDTTSADAIVPIRERITDASGVCGQVEAYALQPSAGAPTGYGRFVVLELESGDKYDGIWTGELRIPQGSVGGRWNLELRASDCASVGVNHADSVYFGPDVYPYYAGQTHFGNYRPIQDGLGIVNVVGRARDHQPPVVSEVQFSATEVDTLPGPVDLDVTVRAVDPNDVDWVSVALVPEFQPAPWLKYETSHTVLVSGSAQDGTWRGTITLPQGLAPGVYYAVVTAWDGDGNSVTYYSSGYPDVPSQPHLLENNPTVWVLAPGAL